MHHVALIVNVKEDIELFYKKVLQFEIHHSFIAGADILTSIFGIDKEVEVFYLVKEAMAFELFVSPIKEKKVFSHVCIAYKKSEMVYEKALQAGYRTFVKKRIGHDTYFIWDKSRNMFEIKEDESGEKG